MVLFKRFFLVAVCVISLLGILVFFLTTLPLRFNDKLSIKNISGDSKVLSDVSIKGVLSDGVQKTDFAFDNGDLLRVFETVKDDSIYQYYYNSEYPPNLPNLHVMKSFDIPDDADKRVTTGTDDNGNKITDIIANKAVMTLGTYEFKLIETEVIIMASDYSINQRYTENGNKPALEQFGSGKDTGIDTHDLVPVETVKDKNYIYTTTGADCIGFGGIYELEIVNKKWTVKQGNLAPLDLKDGKVQIVGMKATKDWFVYITVEDNQVVLKPFNRKSKLFNKDVLLGGVPEEARTIAQNSYDPDAQSYQICKMFYNADIQNDEYFNVEIMKRFTEGYPISDFYCVSLLDDKVVLKYEEYASFYDGEKGQYLYSTNTQETIMKYEKNKLYVLRSYQELPFSVSRDNNTNSLNSVYISVYGNDENIYEGEIRSAALDDYNFQGIQMYKVYGKTYMRGFYYLKID